MFFLVLAAVVGAIGVFTFKHWSPSARHKLLASQARSIRYFKDGEVARIHGKAQRGAEILSAPLSGRACVAYSICIDRRTAGSSSYDRVLVDDSACADFVVESGSDPSGIAFVHTKGAELILEFDDERFDDEIPFALTQGKTGARSDSRSRDLRGREAIVAPGDYVYVLGLGRWEVDPDPRHQPGDRSTAQRLVMGPSPKSPVIVSDRDPPWLRPPKPPPTARTANHW